MSTLTTRTSAEPSRDKATLTAALPRRRRRRFRVGRAVLVALSILISIAYIYPFVITIANSFKTDSDATNSPLSLIPHPVTFAAYTQIFSTWFPQALMNSVIVAVTVTIGRAFLDSLAGYALARLPFPGRRAVFASIIAVLAVPGVVLLIPRFLVLQQLGIYDTYAGLIVPLLGDAAGIFIMKGFFESLPSSVEEAAYIDGAGMFRTFWSIVLPMAAPAVITILILSFQGSWNELSHFIVAAQDPALSPLTKAVAALTAGGQGKANMFPLKLAAALLMTIPVAAIFFTFQRRIINTSAGATKG